MSKRKTWVAMGGAFVSHVTKDVKAKMRRPRRINWWSVWAKEAILRRSTFAIPMLSVISVWSLLGDAGTSVWCIE